jgi:2-oxoglutarate dehydrogenase E1 component
MPRASSVREPASALPLPDWHDPLVRAYRTWGYLQASFDPLERLQPSVHPDIAELSADANPDQLETLRRAYCGSMGVEFMHLRDRERASWIAARIEDEASNPRPVDRRRIFERVLRAEVLERFLHRRYIGSKRYSLEGAVGLIPLMDSVLDGAARSRMETALIGMSHRGRLTVMVNTVGVPAEAMFAGLEDIDPRSTLGAGDVKYHLGATGVHHRPEGGEVGLHLVSNPSHLEAVNPVLMGRARARQMRCSDPDATHLVLPICLHGDAAFAGQGITSETLNLATLEGYGVGGTVHVIVNNLIGFTAEPLSLHSSLFSSDAAHRIQIPVLHVNAEDPEALERAGRFALDYRNRFGSDVLIDLVGYRRYGHSEVEDPTTTSPLLYERISERPLLHEQLAEHWGIGPTEVEEQRKAVEADLDVAQERGRQQKTRPRISQLPYWWNDYVGGQYDPDREVHTAVPGPVLDRLAQRIAEVPDGFTIHSKLGRFLDQRQKMLRGEAPLDFGAAECAAFASLLLEGRRIRLSGQDCRRGTFNHRNAALVDPKTGAVHVPLAHLSEEQGPVEIIDSPLSEAAILGFEYGFSRDWPDALVLWEAQFGDFANGAQIIIDQFLAAGEDKWSLLSGLVMLLPHGYEGQGPEHSSARIERFLQLCSEHNLQIAQPSTAAQYFHLLRRQALRGWRKPLVVFTPKGMLRAKPACSDRRDISDGLFQPLIVDGDPSTAERILVCSGKIAHELAAERSRRQDERTVILRLEELYPLPETALHDALAEAPKARKVIWVQEEAANMGALAYVRPELQRLAGGRHVTSVKRSASASPATGSAKAHRLEQEALLRLAFA